MSRPNARFAEPPERALFADEALELLPEVDHRQPAEDALPPEARPAPAEPPLPGHHQAARPAFDIEAIAAAIKAPCADVRQALAMVEGAMAAIEQSNCSDAMLAMLVGATSLSRAARLLHRRAIDLHGEVRMGIRKGVR